MNSSQVRYPTACSGARLAPARCTRADNGHREILGLHVTTSEDGAGWLAFFREEVLRSLVSVPLLSLYHLLGHARASERPLRMTLCGYRARAASASSRASLCGLWIA